MNDAPTCRICHRTMHPAHEHAPNGRAWQCPVCLCLSVWPPDRTEEVEPLSWWLTPAGLRAAADRLDEAAWSGRAAERRRAARACREMAERVRGKCRRATTLVD